jgi:pyruvate oxidase
LADNAARFRLLEVRPDLRGAFGVRVSDAGQLDDALMDAIAHDGPTLVEVITDAELV